MSISSNSLHGQLLLTCELQIALVLSWSVRGASHQPVFIGDCLNFVTCVFPYLPGKWVSFCVPGAIKADVVWV